MTEEIRRIVQEGWKDDAKQNQNPRELLKGAVFEMRRRVDGVKHQFQNSDGTTRTPEAWVKNRGGDVAATKKEIEDEILIPFKKQKRALA